MKSKQFVWGFFFFLLIVGSTYAVEPLKKDVVREVNGVGTPYTPKQDVINRVKLFQAELKARQILNSGQNLPEEIQEEPCGIIVYEFLDESRSRATFRTTRPIKGGFVVFKILEFPDGEQKIFPGIFLESDVLEGESYIFSVWDGNIGNFWPTSGNIGVTVYTFNLLTGKISFVHEVLSSWRGSPVHKDIKFISAAAGEGNPGIRVKISSHGEKVSFFIDGYPIDEKYVNPIEPDVYLIYPPENQRYGGEKLLTLRIGTYCDSIRVRYFENSE